MLKTLIMWWKDMSKLCMRIFRQLHTPPVYTYLLYSTVSTCKGQPFIHLLLSYLLDFISTRVVGFFTYLIRPKSPLSRALVRLRLGRWAWPVDWLSCKLEIVMYLDRLSDWLLTDSGLKWREGATYLLTTYIASAKLKFMKKTGGGRKSSLDASSNFGTRP